MPSTATDRLAGIHTSVAVKPPCRVATTASITLIDLQTVNGVALSAGDRVLVKDQADPIENGIYVAGTGDWYRAKDFDGTYDAVGGTQVYVLAGTYAPDSYYKVDGTTPASVVIGTDEITFTLSAASAAVATIQGIAADVAEDVAEAAELVAEAQNIVFGNQVVTPVAADYTIAALDCGALLLVDSASPTNIYYPPGQTKGHWVDVVQQGSGAVYILADLGATVDSLLGYNKITGQYGRAKVEKVAEVERINLSGDLNGVGSIGWITSAVIMPEGWTIKITMLATHLDGTADVSKLALTVTSEGYTAVAGVNGAGSVTLGTVTRNLTITSVLRRAYASQAQDQVDLTGDLVSVEVLCSLSEQVFDDDKNGGAGTSGVDPVLVASAGWWMEDARSAPGQTLSNLVVGSSPITNTSTEDYPLPNAGWNMPPLLISSDYANKFWMEVIGAELLPANGRPLAAVKYTVTGATSAHAETEVVIDVSNTAGTFGAAKTYPSIAFKSNGISDAAYTAKEVVSQRFQAYPRVGDTPLDSADYTFGSAYSTGGRSVVRPANYPGVADPGATYGRLYACYSSTGVDAAGVVSATFLTAYATPFLTQAKALYKLQDTSNTTLSRNNLGNHVLHRKGSGAFSFDMKQSDPNPPATTFTQDDCNAQDTWLHVTGDAGAFITPNASGSARHVGPRTHLAVPIDTSGGGTFDAIIGPDTTGATQHLWVSAAVTGLNSGSFGPIKQVGWQYFTGFTATTVGKFLAAQGTNNSNIMLARDLDFPTFNSPSTGFVHNGIYVAQMSDVSFLTQQGATSSTYQNDGAILCNVGLYKHPGVTNDAILLTDVRSFGSAAINVLIEAIPASGAHSIVRLNADANVNATQKHFWHHVGIVGPAGTRMNVGYEDGTTLSGSGQIKKLFSFRFCYFNEFNHKDDTFANNGSNIHTWGVGHHVNWRYNTFLRGSSNADIAPGRTSWLGEVFNTGEYYAGATSTLFVGWNVTTGGGDYTPVGALTSRIPANAYACKLDLKGGTRANDGTEALGPIKK